MILDKQKEGIEGRFYDLCQTVVPQEGLSLYDLSYVQGSTKLSVFIVNDQTGSADIDDCVKVDKALSPYLEEDWVPNELTLEVSSPGVYRNLTNRVHFENAVGNSVQLVLIRKLEFDDLPRKLRGQKKIVAFLNQVSENALELVVDEYKFNVQFENLKKVTLHPDINR